MQSFICKLNILLFCFLFEKTIAQDTSLLKLNYGFSYDRHKYEEFVKENFCYTNKLGIIVNHYFLKQKNLGVGLTINSGLKKMHLTANYKRLVDPTPHFEVYDLQKEFDFKYDYILAELNLRVSYIIKHRVEPFICIGKNYNFLASKNFKEDSLIFYTAHGFDYEYRKTYVIPNKIQYYGLLLGVNFRISNKIQLGLSTSYQYSGLIRNLDPPGRTSSLVMFGEFNSYSLQVNYKIY